MSDFPGKSAKSRRFASLHRLTARLPEVGKVTALPEALIRVPDRPKAAWKGGVDWCFGRLQGAVIAYQSGQVQLISMLPARGPEKTSPAQPEIARGWTPMGRSTHQAGSGLEPARWLGGLLATGLLFLAFLLGLTQAASAQGAVRSVHGDWQIRCDTPPGAQGEQCALIQSVVAEDRSNAGLTVIVLKTADQKSRLMRVVAPLGVLLPSGLGLKLDNQDVGRAGFVRCLPNGCVAEVVMDDKLLGQLRTAKTATFIIFETPEEGIGFPLSLNGLGEGYDKLP
jgi:invasion protein IalB